MIKFAAMETTDNLIIIGDRVLIKPKAEEIKTKSGLYLHRDLKKKKKSNRAMW